MQIKARLLDKNKRIFAVAISGDILPSDISQVTACLNSIIEQKAQNIILAFKQCGWASAYFIRILFSFYDYIKRCGGSFAIANSNPELTDIFTSYQLLDAIRMFPSDIDAFDSISGKKKLSSIIDDKRKSLVLQKIMEGVEKEDAMLKRGGLLPVNRDVWNVGEIIDGETDTVAAAQNDKGAGSEREGNKATGTIKLSPEEIEVLVKGTVEDFTETMGMNLEEMGVADKHTDSDSEMTSFNTLGSDGFEEGIVTKDNAVQFIKLEDLTLEKDSEYEQKIILERNKINKERALAPKTRDEKKDISGYLSGIDLYPRPKAEESFEDNGEWAEHFDQVPFWNLLQAVPETEIAGSLKKLVEIASNKIDKAHKIVVVVDSLTLSSGIARWIIKLVNKKLVSNIIISLTAALKDFECSYGISCKNKKEEVFTGSFGVSRETWVAFTQRSNIKNTSPAEIFRDLVLKKSGTNKDGSIIYHCVKNDVIPIIPFVEYSPFLLRDLDQNFHQMFSVNELNKTVDVMIGEDFPLVLFPGNSDLMYSFFLDVMQIISNGSLSIVQTTVGDFSEKGTDTFWQVISASGGQYIGVKGDYSFFFPYFVESILGLKGL